MNKKSNFCAWVTGRDKDLDRNLLRQQFSNFGTPRKIFVNEEHTLAKVYIDDCIALKQACEALNGHLSWKIEFCLDDYNKDQRVIPGIASNNQFPTMDGDYLDYDVNVITDYVDVHGNPLTVLEGDEGDLYVSLTDVKRAGFAIFKRDNYDPVITDRRQILREFELHLLAEGKKYLLKTKVNLQQEEILKTIQEVERKLLGNDVKSPSSTFTSNRKIDQTGNKITIKTENVQTQNSFEPAPLTQTHAHATRPPNNQGNNVFGASHSNHALNSNSKFDRNNQDGNKENRKFSGNFRPNQNQSGGFRQTNGQQVEQREPKLWDQQGARPRRTNDTRAPRPTPTDNKTEEDWGSENKSPPKSDFATTPKAEIKTPPTSNFKSAPKFESKENERVETGSVASSRSSYIEGASIGKVTIPVGAIETVRITHIQKRIDNSDIYYANLTKNNEIVENLLVEAAEAFPDQSVMQPEKGSACLFEFEELWYRGEILEGKHGMMVYLLDYGNREKAPSILKVLPENLAKIPAQAIRMAIHQKEGEENVYNFKVDDEVQIVVKKQFNDGTYVVGIAQDSKSEDPTPFKEVPKPKAEEVNQPLKDEKENAYFDLPKSVDTLRDAEKVLLVDYKNDRLILKTKACVKQCKDINSYIECMEKKPIKNVVVNQLVLCSKDGLNGFHRAVVSNLTESVAKVDYIDYFGEGDLSIKSLRNMDDKLAKEPCALIISPEYKCIENMKNAASDFVAQLIEEKEKLDVVLNGTKFDLRLPNNTLLSEKIYDLNNPKKVEMPKPTVCKPVPEQSVDVSTDDVKTQSSEDGYEVVSYDDMPFMEPTTGAAEYMCYTFIDTTQITLLSSTDQAMLYLEQLMEIKVTDNRPYQPSCFEMCLAKYQGVEDAVLWYRGVVTEKSGNQYTIQFVDYGNSETVTCENIRRFPQNLKNIPILGINAFLKDVPSTPEVIEKLKEEFSDGSFHSVKIDTLEMSEDLKYAIEVPEVYEKLRKSGLMK